jgi:hypothetical protein
MFLNLVGNIFAFWEATFFSAIKANVSRYGRTFEQTLKITNISATTVPLRLAKASV